ncbi:MAG: NAD(P)H-dependent oxidoreductase subunit E [bacterium]|nr:NAD(P)H-dependent oxidoreductase subunit E [bacterium]
MPLHASVRLTLSLASLIADMKKLSEATLTKIANERTKYPSGLSVLLPTLWWAQEERLVFDVPTMDYIAEILEISPIRVYEAVTFYTMFNRKPVGRYHFQVCHNISCSILGAEHIIEYLKKKLNVGEGEVTPDGLFSVTRAECLGSCGTAPMLQMNDRFYENLTEARLDYLISELRNDHLPDKWND